MKNTVMKMKHQVERKLDERRVKRSEKKFRKIQDESIKNYLDFFKKNHATGETFETGRYLLFTELQAKYDC